MKKNQIPVVKYTKKVSKNISVILVQLLKDITDAFRKAKNNDVLADVKVEMAYVKNKKKTLTELKKLKDSYESMIRSQALFEQVVYSLVENGSAEVKEYAKSFYNDDYKVKQECYENIDKLYDDINNFEIRPDDD